MDPLAAAEYRENLARRENEELQERLQGYRDLSVRLHAENDKLREALNQVKDAFNSFPLGQGVDWWLNHGREAFRKVIDALDHETIIEEEELKGSEDCSWCDGFGWYYHKADDAYGYPKKVKCRCTERAEPEVPF